VRTVTRRRIGVIAVITLALAGLLSIGGWALSSGPGGWGMMRGHGPVSGDVGDGPGMMGGAGMMGGGYGLAGTGPVTSLGQARSAAQRFADGLGLRVGEVMQFSDGFYADLGTPTGERATEVLVDAEDGDVRIEYGPAMMWNTEYGMHASRSTLPARVSGEEARNLANRWLAGRGGLTVGEPEVFPGYYTLHTLRAGKITGMLSVNAYTGAVWYHTWHGEFVDMSEG
jgi:hypothetical protein